MVLPAHAGVILINEYWNFCNSRITRTCGGDPWNKLDKRVYPFVLPAHAGVILHNATEYRLTHRITRTCGGDPTLPLAAVMESWYYPHMRG